MPTFVRRSRLDAPADEVYAWLARPGALRRLTPGWAGVEVVQAPERLEEGARAVLRVRLGPFATRWVVMHGDIRPGRAFRDEQVEGPFARWVHEHVLEPARGGGSILEDRIEYAFPAAPIGALAAAAFTRRRLERLFEHRHRVLAEDLRAHRRAGFGPVRIAVSGASGLLGSALVPFLSAAGHRVVRLVRRAPRAQDEVGWDPRGGRVDVELLEGVDAVVHLAGEPIAGGRWTAGRKREIRASRVEGTRLLAGALARLARPPQVLVCASAVGYYGDRGAEPLDERSGPGSGFLSEVCRAWEQAADAVREARARVVALRFGLVLDAAGGGLGRMVTPFRLGLGARLGDGRQYVSWIALDDALGAVLHALATPGLDGPVNAVASEPVTNAAFTRTLARVLRRPARAAIPAGLLRLALGDLADEALLASQRVLPRRLEETRFVFRHPRLEGALRAALGRPAAARGEEGPQGA